MKSQESLFEEFEQPKKKAETVKSGGDAATDERIIAQIHDIARAIPAGRVMSYGAVGAQSQPPISGYICGRIMIHAHEQVPWWRVVGKDGTLRISRRNPLLARDQRDRLEAEGVGFDDAGRVDMANFEQ